MKEVSKIVFEDDELKTLRTIIDFCEDQWCDDCVFKCVCDNFLKPDLPLKKFIQELVEEGEL